MQHVRDKLRQVERDAAGIAGKLQPFSFDVFERKYIQGNILFRQKKIKLIAVPEAEEDSFNYGPFLKRFPVFTGNRGKAAYAFLVLPTVHPQVDKRRKN